MNKKLKTILIFVAVFVIIAFVGYKYAMTAGARNLSSETSAFKTNSKEIIAEFSTDANDSNKKYLNKAIEISGIITTSTANQIILDETIICEINENKDVASNGKTITVKGRFVGFDDLLGELKLDCCSIVK